jgi:hypothetical protein
MSEVLRGQVGERAEHLISNVRDPEGNLDTGNVLRRTCTLGGEACKQTCQLREEWTDFEEESTSRELVIEAMRNRTCSDLNQRMLLMREGLLNKNVLVIGVTANKVGFGDKLDEYYVKENEYGWKELVGYNAFFARETEVEALGRRLADCADINFEFQDQGGNTVIGFEHGTRTNMFGSTAFVFERNGEKVSFTEYALGQAIDHYGADPTKIRIKLAAAIRGHNFTKHFDSREAMERHLPGWYADGFLNNISNPEWREGNPVVDSDTWEADTRTMILRDIHNAMEKFGIPLENLDTEGIIDPGDTKGVHSSHQFAEEYGDTRDLYLTFIRSEEAERRIMEAKKKGEEVARSGSYASKLFNELEKKIPDAAEMTFGSDAGLRGQPLVDYWDQIGRGQGGFYDDIRQNGCSNCGSHTPGCCDGCA